MSQAVGVKWGHNTLTVLTLGLGFMEKPSSSKLSNVLLT
jgi:hypothetical protein